MLKAIRTFFEKHLSAENDFGPDPATSAVPVAKPAPADESAGFPIPANADGERRVAKTDGMTAEQAANVHPDADIPAPHIGDTRRALVNVFEYTYGALLPLVIFCLLIFFADPAQEVLIGFLADAQPVVDEFNAVDLIVGDTGVDYVALLLSPLFLALAALFCVPVTAHGLAVAVMKLYRNYGVQKGSEGVVAYDLKVAEYVFACIPLIGFVGISAALFKAMASEEALAMGLTQMPLPVIALIGALGLYATFFAPIKAVSVLARLVFALLFKIVNETLIGGASGADPAVSPSQKIEIIALVDEERPTTPAVSGTLGAPVAAFMGAWRERGAQSARRVEELFLETPGVSTCEANTDPHPLNFTVSWYLSRASFTGIANDVEEEIRRAQIGAPQDGAASKTCPVP